MTGQAKRSQRARPALLQQVGRALKQYFLTGLATLFPVAFTIWLVVLIFKTTDGFLGHYLGVQVPGLGILVTFLAILVVGVVSVHLFGRLLFGAVEEGFSHLPLVKRIYPAVKQITQFFFNNEEGKTGGLRRVVLVEFPKEGLYALAFVTNEYMSSITGQPKKILTLLVSNPPSPLSGPVLFVPEEKVIPIDISVEDALKLIVSGGVVGAPLQPATQDNQARKN